MNSESIVLPPALDPAGSDADTINPIDTQQTTILQTLLLQCL